MEEKLFRNRQIMTLVKINSIVISILLIRFGITFGTVSALFVSLSFYFILFLYHYKQKNRSMATKITFNMIITGYIIVVMVVVTLLTLILSESKTVVKEYSDVDYAIVLGAGLYGDKISPILKIRLDTAYDQLKDSDIPIIVSGGQGPDELISEAEAMATYLVEKGIKADRIILEDQSTSTKENIKFSNNLVNKENKDLNVVFFTSDYHMYRAKMLGERIGWNSQGYAGINPFFVRLNFMIREVFDLFKDIILL